MNRGSIYNVNWLIEESNNLLLENRLTRVKEKYPQQVHNLIDELSENDPSDNNKYLDWLAKQTLYSNKEIAELGYFDMYGDNLDQNISSWIARSNIRRVTNFKVGYREALYELIQYFHKYNHKFDEKDINQYKSIKELDEATELAKQKLSRKEIKEGGVDKVYEDEDFLLVMPKTHKAACRYGSNTRWCVTMKTHPNYFKNYFTDGPIFFLMDKRRLEPSDSPKYMQTADDYYKVAIHYQPRIESDDYYGLVRIGGSKASKIASKVSKEKFVNSASLDNTKIDYWNSVDELKSESVVRRYLGGPGRGQKARADQILGNLKNVMEKYTKKILSDYYDKLNIDTEKVEKIEELTNKINDLKSKRDKVYNIFSSLDRNLSNLRWALSVPINSPEEIVSIDGFDEAEVEDFRSMIRVIKNKKDKYDEIYNKISNKVIELDNELTSLRSDIENKSLRFYRDETI